MGGHGEVAPKNAPGFGDVHLKPAETVGDTVKYISKSMTNPPKYKELIEGIGYPGQKHSAISSASWCASFRSGCRCSGTSRCGRTSRRPTLCELAEGFGKPPTHWVGADAHGCERRL